MAQCIIHVLGLLTFVLEVSTEFCGDGDDTYCHSPSKCCKAQHGCCYDSMHFRLQVWNMWYFWFLIIFMMMSCFGGCGYYRRRRMAMLAQNSSHGLVVPYPSTQRLGMLARATRIPELNYMAYRVSRNVPDNSRLSQQITMPPAYAEVMTNSGVYPVNSKIDLPPYPGEAKQENIELMPIGPLSEAAECPNSTFLPPPYSEFPDSDCEFPVSPHSHELNNIQCTRLSAPSQSSSQSSSLTDTACASEASLHDREDFVQNSKVLSDNVGSSGTKI